MATVNALHVGPADDGCRTLVMGQQARSTILPGLAIGVSELWVEAAGGDDLGDGGQA